MKKKNKILKFFRKQEVKEIFILYLITRISLFIIGIFARFVILPYEDIRNIAGKIYLDIWIQQDSAYYLGLAESYVEHAAAFFPLYPWLIKVLNIFINDMNISGFLISNVCLFLSLYFIYELLVIDFNKKLVLKTIFYLLIFPTSFFFSAVYTESLFLLLTVLAFYYAKKENWFLASLFGGLSALARLVGVFLILPLFWMYIKQNGSKIKANILYFSFIPSGLFTYMFFLYYKFGNALAFVHSIQGWGKAKHSIFNELAAFEFLSFNTVYIAFFLIALFTVGVLFFNRRYEYAIFGAYSILIPILSGQFVSIWRYIIVFFPMFLVFAQYVSKNQKINTSLTILFLMSQGLLFALFANGYPIM